MEDMAHLGGIQTMAYIVIACIVMAHVVVAYIVMASNIDGTALGKHSSSGR